MTKLIAIVNVVAWAGFWAFGYLALTEHGTSLGALILAAVGGATGIWAYLQLVRHAEATGFAEGQKRQPPEKYEIDLEGVGDSGKEV